LTMAGWAAPTGIVCDTAAGYSGTPVPAACSAVATAFVVTGCTLTTTDCILPTTTGYNFASIAGVLTMAGWAAPTGIVCDTAAGYSGTPVPAVCGTVATAFTVTGCAMSTTDCILPTTTGYNFASIAGALTLAGWAAPTGIVCDTAAGYGGTPVPAACSAVNTAFTVTGCTTDCILPTTAGYNTAGTTGALTMAGWVAPTGIVCDTAAGYSGTPVPAVCGTVATAFTVTGCAITTTDCILPTTAGYKTAGSTGALTMAGWAAPTGIVCDTGYTGTPVPAVCSAVATAFTVTGCTMTSATTTAIAGSGGNGTATTLEADSTASFGRRVSLDSQKLIFASFIFVVAAS